MTLSRKTAKNEALLKGWRRVKLGELCSDISYGYTATASNQPIGPKFLRITDIVSDRINWEDVPYCKIEDSKIDKYTLGIGDIVIARTGATTGYNQIIRSDVHSVFASYLIRCKLKQSIAYPFFISCVLQSAYWRNFIEGIKTRSAQPGANAKDFSSFRIPLPTLPEQKAIASLLETWDTAIEKTEALIAEKEKQFKWLLKTLISDQQDNPEWRKVTLGDACGVIVSPVDKKTVDGELPVKLCNYTDVYYNDTIGSEIDFMAATAKPLEIENFSIIEGDVIITKDSETPDDIGVPAYVKKTIDNLLCGYHLAILRPNKKTIGKYVCYALTSPRAKYDFYRFANGITRFGLTTESYQKIRISLPLLPEQKRIVNLLDTSKKEIDVLKQLAEQYRTQKRGLMQKLLTGKWRIQIGGN